MTIGSTHFRVLFFIVLVLFSINAYASRSGGDNQDYIELGIAKSKTLDEDVYVPNATIASVGIKNKAPFQITLGFLNKDVSRLHNGEQQALKDVFYIGPQYNKRFRLNSGFHTELGVAILTGNLDYQSTKTNSSSYRNGMFLGIQPKAKLVFRLYKRLSFVVDLNYILTSINLDKGSLDIGPSIGIGPRYNLDL